MILEIRVVTSALAIAGLPYPSLNPAGVKTVPHSPQISEHQFLIIIYDLLLRGPQTQPMSGFLSSSVYVIFLPAYMFPSSLSSWTGEIGTAGPLVLDTA